MTFPFLFTVPTNVSLNDIELKNIIWKIISSLCKNEEVFNEIDVCSLKQIVLALNIDYVQYVDSVSQILQSSLFHYQMNKTNQWNYSDCNAENQLIRTAYFSRISSSMILHLDCFSFVEGMIKKDDVEIQIFKRLLLMKLYSH
jgi:hypothetical protein